MLGRMASPINQASFKQKRHEFKSHQELLSLIIIIIPKPSFYLVS